MREIVFAALAAVTLTSAARGCEVTKAQYQALSDGMTYKQAIAVIGCEGDEMSRNSIGGIVTIMLMWSGKGMIGANMNAIFQDDRLVSKSQFGLK